MTRTTSAQSIPAVKDDRNELPIPSDWRPRIAAIVSSFVRGDYQISDPIPGVAPVPEDTAVQIEEYIDDYAEELIELPDETWDTSVCIWEGERWSALIDLWTQDEGRSDMVLQIYVSESADGYLIDVYMVYVP